MEANTNGPMRTRQRDKVYGPPTTNLGPKVKPKANQNSKATNLSHCSVWEKYCKNQNSALLTLISHSLPCRACPASYPTVRFTAQ